MASDPQDLDASAKACHQMLLALAGRAPDDLLTQCRSWLADRELGQLARSMTFWALVQDAALAEEDIALLSELLGQADADPWEVLQIRLGDGDSLPFYAFAPSITAEPVSARDTTGPGAKARAKVEQAALKAVAAEPGAIGLWAAWRTPYDGAPWPPPRRVFVAEVSRDVSEPGVAARIQNRLAAAGEPSPQVEVYRTGEQLPSYQAFARSGGELLWASTEDPGIQVAAVFDEVDAVTGPRFRPDHRRLDDSEGDKVASYLRAGELLLVAASGMDDVIDPTALNCVPMSFRTDGRWIWADACAYYVERHRLEPDPGLLAHLRSNDYTVPPVDGVAVYRALKVLEQPSDEEPAWTSESGTWGREEEPMEADLG